MEPELRIIDSQTGGLIEENEGLMDNLPRGGLSRFLFNHAQKGTPLLKFGYGEPRIMIIAGIHGNEIPPQISAVKLINHLATCEVDSTIFIIPFAIPGATMKNSRRFSGFDMNRQAHRNGVISNTIMGLLKSLKIDALADFHSTQRRSNPGVEGVFCSKNPCPESYRIAEHITSITNSKIICQNQAGALYKGALEDEANLSGVPAVTCEVVSPNGKANQDSIAKSYLQMRAYLDFFGIKI